MAAPPVAPSPVPVAAPVVPAPPPLPVGPVAAASVMRVDELLASARERAVAGIRREDAPGQVSNEIICSICQYPIDPANWRENLSLPCGHVYHERCHREMIGNSGGRLPADECPVGRCNSRHAQAVLVDHQADLDAEWEVVEQEVNAALGRAVPGEPPAVPGEPAAPDEPPAVPVPAEPVIVGGVNDFQQAVDYMMS